WGILIAAGDHVYRIELVVLAHGVETNMSISLPYRLVPTTSRQHPPAPPDLSTSHHQIPIELYYTYLFILLLTVLAFIYFF
ncbi:jg2090, partial [Pararge aegeria aegeria]